MYSTQAKHDLQLNIGNESPNPLLIYFCSFLTELTYLFDQWNVLLYPLIYFKSLTECLIPLFVTQNDQSFNRTLDAGVYFPND